MKLFFLATSPFMIVVIMNAVAYYLTGLPGLGLFGVSTSIQHTFMGIPLDTWLIASLLSLVTYFIGLGVATYRRPNYRPIFVSFGLMVFIYAVFAYFGTVVRDTTPSWSLARDFLSVWYIPTATYTVVAISYYFYVNRLRKSK